LNRARLTVGAPDYSASLSVTTWNLGYGGLGAGSDFITDGGSHWFPPSRRAVLDNVAAISQWLSQDPADLVLTQELADACMPNYWVDLKAAIEKATVRRSGVFAHNLSSRIPIWPLSMRIGIATYSKARPLRSEVWDLPIDGDISARGLRRRYCALATRLPIDGDTSPWLIVNLHLAAFDAGARLRRRQMSEVLRRAKDAFAGGDRVILGGDWNMSLTRTDFPHTTRPENLAWLVDLDRTLVPDGWSVVCDPCTPSFRSNDRPFTLHKNYTGVIDGFIVSPNVSASSVECADLGFCHSDHQPVHATFSAKRNSEC
jgi:endonuclease/exonuclease/phosphatase family metal-dependent hydrolase